MRPWRRFLAAFLAVAVALVFAPTAAAADNANCKNDGGAVFQFSGDEQVGSVKHGILGRIDGQTLHQCTMPDLIEWSGTFTWVAVHPSGGSDFALIQIGVGACRAPGSGQCGDDMRIFTAWGRKPSDPGCSGFSEIPPVIGSEGLTGGVTREYKVWHHNNRWSMYADGVEKQWVGEASICWSSTSVETFSETWDNGDALGGSATNKMRVTGMKYAQNEGGVFVNTVLSGPCTWAPGAPRFCTTVNATTVDMWTDR